MKTISKVLGVEKTLAFASVPKYRKGRNVGLPLGVKSTPKLVRVEKEELENCYRLDPITFNSINKIVQTIMAAGHEIYANDKKVLKFFQEFVENIGNVGEPITWEEWLNILLKDETVFGEHHTENVFNKKGNQIVDLNPLDPKKMDYAKDGSGEVILDEYARPIGYTMEVPYDVDTSDRGDKPPEVVSIPTNGIFLIPERIAHFKLYTIGSGLYPVGLVEPAYKSILRKQNIEEAQTNSIYARGTFPLIDYVGDENHYPTADMTNAAADALKKIAHHRYMAFPYWHKIEPLEIKQSEIVDKTMQYLRENQSASLGMPLAFATGAGEKTNRATLSNQQKFLEFTLNDIVKRTISNIRKQIFKPICVLNGFKEIPTIKWGNISAEEVNEKAKRLAEYYVRRGILQPSDVTEFAKKSEQI